MLRNGKREARDALRRHHDELGTAKGEPFELLGRSLGYLSGKYAHLRVSNHIQLILPSFTPQNG